MTVTAGWKYPPVPKMRVQGRSTVEDNFAPEKRSPLEIFIREATQNPLDARRPDLEGPVEVKFRQLGPKDLDATLLEELVDDEYIRRLNASGTYFNRPAGSSVLVVEDFGTIGLEGVTDNPDCDGQKQNWNAFWFREGEGAKATAGSNGRAGQGKITYYRTSAVRAVFGFTKRASGGPALLMGRSSFRRNYELEAGGGKFERDAFWCRGDGEVALPVQDGTSLERFRSAFQLERDGESGLSLVVPYPAPFSAKDAIRTLISDFYFPIASGRLAVTVAGARVDAGNLRTVAASHLPDAVARQHDSCFTAGFRGFVDGVLLDGPPSTVAMANWWKGSSLSDNTFAPGVVAKLREALAAGRRIAVRFPLTVRPVGTGPLETWLDVYLQMPEDLEAAEEAYIRRDLLIGSERQLGKARHLPPARGLTLIGDSTLSAFMADAEEPTHMKWNASRPRLGEDYDSPRETVAAVRHAMPRLLALLANAASRRDTKALAGLFSKATPEAGGRRPAGPKAKPSGGSGDEFHPPPPAPRPFRWSHGATWERVFSQPGHEPPTLPLVATITFAYLGVDDDAFSAYDPFDFNLEVLKNHPVEAVGCSVLGITLNRVTVSISGFPFSLQVGGFDPNLRRRMKIDYEAAVHGTDVIDQ